MSIKIFADMRERSSGILESLKDLGILVEIKRLEVGDFILSERVVVERKNINDFVSSLVDKRLFEQASEMRKNFDCPLILLEGDFENMFLMREINSKAIWAALAALVIDFKVPFLFTASPQESAQVLALISKREQAEKKLSISLRGQKRARTLAEAQQFFIEGLPGIGPTLAKALLQKFKSPFKILTASEEKLQKVEKLGPKKAQMIKKILEKRYKEDT